MPIGDLLASISGSEPAPKRKAIADDTLSRLTPNKVPRTSTASTPAASSSAGPSRAQQPSRPLDRPNAVARPPSNANGAGNGLGALGGTRMSGLSSTLKPTNGTHRVTKPTAAPRFAGTARPQQSGTGGSGSDGPAAASAASRAPPKKGSFAEILARGKAAQETMGKVGKIQHKKTEKGAAKPGNDVVVGKGGGPQKPDPRSGRVTTPGARGSVGGQQVRKPTGAASGYSGTAKPNAIRPAAGGRSTTPTNGHASSSAAAKRSSARPSDRKAAAPEPERPKKAATATTGYTGTARPRPGATTTSNSHKSAQRGGALLNRQPARRPGASSARGGNNSRYDEYDDELDDFIDYDDEEEEEQDAGGYGRRYTYNDESDSDMEAGMDELDIEERMAERIARREDIEEEKLEKGLKAAKEERKRKALEELRAKRR